ncbi:TPA: hypothetical protein ACGNDF_001519 [Streptococcus agalactiae]
MYKVIDEDTNEVLGLFESRVDATNKACELEIAYQRKLFPTYEEESETDLEELPDYELLSDSIYRVIDEEGYDIIGG